MNKFKLNSRSKKLSTFVPSNRFISIVGSNRSNIFTNHIFDFTISNFESYIKGIFKSFSSFYVLTNKSKLSGCITNIFLLSILFQTSINTRFYVYLQSNNRTVIFPAGIAKLIDYICVPLRGANNDDFSSVDGLICSNFNLSKFIEFLKHEYLDILEIQLEGGGVREKLTNSSKLHLDSLVLILVRLGFSITRNELITILNALISELEGCVGNEHRLFELTIDSFELIASFVKDIQFVSYCPSRSSTNKLGVYKIRNSDNLNEYLVYKKAFVSSDTIAQQIMFYYLVLFRPTKTVNGHSGYHPESNDGIIDLSQHKLSAVFNSLLNIKAVEVNLTEAVRQGGDLDNQRREFTTFAKYPCFSVINYVTFNHKTYKPATVLNNKTIVYASRPLPITIRDVFS